METPLYSTCDCRDSALSSTANVLSILTFAYILIAGTLYQVAALYRVKSDSDWAAVQAQATRLRDFAWSIERRDAISTEFFKRLDDLDKEIARKLPGNVATGKWHLVWRQARSTWDRAEIEEKLYSLAQMRLLFLESGLNDVEQDNKTTDQVLDKARTQLEESKRLFLTQLRSEPKERRRRTLDAIKSESGERGRAAWEEIEDVIKRLDAEDVERRGTRGFVEGV
ncbi:hypothetical protein J4E83_000192 [Alternaria metachromatica]|uniref:uncharacterized protein n=1 Tax=Alternaria metachromatica TaxID=283354 RepID=UPI0020C28D3B|nr:uncharacterized protein J4E83_000192 [Alternaria metachromatica]KAI4637376.1 hypothetical protein J4E83_000192 [Alternaria metachromatica]